MIDADIKAIEKDPEAYELVLDEDSINLASYTAKKQSKTGLSLQLLLELKE